MGETGGDLLHLLKDSRCASWTARAEVQRVGGWTLTVREV